MSSVFQAFPNAIVNTYALVQVQRGTEAGDIYITGENIGVIVDDAADFRDANPDADGVDNDLLLYVRPEDCPTVPSILMANYFIKDTANGLYYEITRAGIGKNQQTGKIEHIELTLKLTDAVEESE